MESRDPGAIDRETADQLARLAHRQLLARNGGRRGLRPRNDHDGIVGPPVTRCGLRLQGLGRIELFLLGERQNAILQRLLRVLRSGPQRLRHPGQQSLHDRELRDQPRRDAAGLPRIELRRQLPLELGQPRTIDSVGRVGKGVVVIGEIALLQPQRDDITVSSSEVNDLIGRLLGEALPTVHFAHCDLARSQQSPEQHRGSFRGRQHGLRLDPSLELFMQSLDQFDVRIDFHWLFGKRVKVNSLSPASSRLSATALHFSRHLRMNALRFVSISCFVPA